MSKEICQFSRCANLLDTRWQPTDERAKKLCAEHADKFGQLVKDGDVAGLLIFFMDGGANSG